MSLDKYRRPRLIVLQSRASAHEAARAMADNHIGSVLVSDNDQLVGIVTDRDIALDVVAAELDPRATRIHDVMSDEIACVDIDDNVSDALEIMRENACRRVPVVSGGRPVGIFTFDVLFFGDAITLDDAGEVIAAQLEAAARFKAQGERHPVASARPPSERSSRARHRRAARAENTYGRMLAIVQQRTGLDSRDRAEQALRVVLSDLCRRLTPNEAHDLLAQLPSKLPPTLDRPFEGPDKSITTETMQADLRHALHVIPEEAGDILLTLCEVIAVSVSAGEIADVRAELPSAMESLFPRMPLREAS